MRHPPLNYDTQLETAWTAHEGNEAALFPRAKVYHIEDDYLWAQIVAKICSEIRFIEYQGISSSLGAGLHACHELTPDIVILDLCLPDSAGWSSIEAVLSLPKKPKILALTVLTNEVMLFCLHKRYIDGLVWKSPRAKREIVDCLRAIADGTHFASSDVRDALRKFRAHPNAFYKILSDSELGLLPALACGMSDSEIAAIHGVEPCTAKAHRLHILHKLEIRSTEKLITWATEKGFFPARPFGHVGR